MPNILADGNTDFYARHVDDASVTSFRKVSLFVEDLIIGQTLLEILTNNRTAVNNTSGIE